MLLFLLVVVIMIKIIKITTKFSANLAVLLVPDGQPLLNRDGENDIWYYLTAYLMIITFYRVIAVLDQMDFSLGRSGRRWCWSRTRIFSSTQLFKTTSMGLHPPLIRRPGWSGEHSDPDPWSLMLNPGSLTSDLSRFKSNSEAGGSRQLEVFGKPVFTEATGNQREKSAIRWRFFCLLRFQNHKKF